MNKFRRTIFVSLSLMFFPLTLALAQDATQPSAEAMEAVIAIEEWAIAPAIENLSPQNTAQSFPATVGTLYCFTKVVGAREETSITHTWYYQDREMAEVILSVRSRYWRTWSSKKIIPGWRGSWRVEVTAEDGTLLKSIDFTVE